MYMDEEGRIEQCGSWKRFKWGWEMHLQMEAWLTNDWTGRKNEWTALVEGSGKV